MKTPEKQRLVLILMTVSQILLTAFVVYWLRAQYLSEKRRLEEHLTGLYIDTQDEMVDSLLFRSYVHPVLTKKSGRAGEKTILDSLTRDTLVISGPKRTLIDKKRPKRSITVKMEANEPRIRSHDSLKLKMVDDEMLLRSVRMIVSHSEDSSGGQPVMRMLKITPADSSVFKHHFVNRLDTSGMRFRLYWGTGMDTTYRNAIHLDVMNPFSLPEVSVAGYGGYLFREIMPQTAFGLALIMITALAFIISYRSIRDHVIMGKLRNEFISNITHELKTPVSTISIALESLGQYNMKSNPDLMDEYLKLASSETKRLEALINRVLDHSLLEENVQPVKMVETDISSLCSETAGIMSHRLGERGKIEFLRAEEALIASCDPLYIKGVLTNLIDNSIKYCGKEPVISVSVRQEGANAIIEVSDNGPGIPEEYRKRIFDKFFRVPSENIHNVKGYGLGLSFASLAMKLHNGTIEVRNRERGCTFTIKLPLHR